jgi:hypothetical protein
MNVPVLRSRIEQTLDLIGIGVDTRQVSTFKCVASFTGQGKVRRVVRSTMLARQDMLDVKRYVSLRRLGEPTVFASIARPFTHGKFRRRVHSAFATRTNRARALACRRLTKSIASTMSRYSACSSGVNSRSLHFSASSSMRA